VEGGIVAQAIFWTAFAVVLYTYAVYPLIMTVWGTFFRRRVDRRYEPVPVSVVIAARDEEGRVADRIRNVLDQEYPPEAIEVILVSDGSRDRTAEEARAIGDPRVRVIELPEPRGKAAALNAGVAEAKHPIVVFTDVRQRFSPGALAELTAFFHDPRVGAVSGELVLSRETGGDVQEGVGLYWEYEKFIRRKESAVDSCVGATGAIYAIRRVLYRPLPLDTILDDFLVPMRIVLAGYRVVFARSAKAFDRVSESPSREFRRKVRTLAGNFQALRYEKRLLDPRRNRLFFQLFSHKLLRLVVPYCAVAMLLACFRLEGAFYRTFLVLQILFYLLPLAKGTPLVRTPLGGLVRVAWTFLALNAAAVVGAWMFFTGRTERIWR
jgi:cellulose synthase/poly-beta-1,6-N-acetylglucosamine synthase-like glycosyltransferase